MKKFAKLAVCTVAAATVCSAMAFAACSKDKDNSDPLMDNWSTLMNFDMESINSFNLYTHDHPGSTDELDGNSRDYENTVIVNKSQEYYYSTYTDAWYSPDNEDAVNGWVSGGSTSYYLKYNEAYYYISINGESTYVSETTQTEVKQMLDSSNELVSSLQMLAQLKSFLSYNKSTGWYEYELASGSLNSTFRVKSENGSVIAQIEDHGDNSITDITFSGKDSTTGTLPDDVKQAIDKYIAEK